MSPHRGPSTGDVFLARLDPVRGSEQGRSRPVVVFQSPDLRRFTSTLLCVPLTANRERLGVPGTRLIRTGDGGLAVDSIALAYQLRALDRSRLARPLGKLRPATVDIRADALLGALGIEVEPI